MQNSWDERTERRKSTDHDTLIEVVQILNNHVQNFNKHVESDETAFKTIRDQIGKHAMYIYIGFGVVATLQFILKH